MFNRQTAEYIVSLLQLLLKSSPERGIYNEVSKIFYCAPMDDLEKLRKQKVIARKIAIVDLIHKH